MFITSMITDRIQRQEVLLPINHITIPFWKLPFFPLDKWLLLWLLWSILWLVDLAEWTSYDWLLQLSDYRCLITTNRKIILLDYTVGLQLHRMITEKWSSWCTNHIWGNCNGYDHANNINIIIIIAQKALHLNLI